jgi:hypothetical protein
MWFSAQAAWLLAGWVGIWFGEAAEADFETEGAELADMVGGLSADAGLAFVVLRSEVLVPHAGLALLDWCDAGCDIVARVPDRKGARSALLPRRQGVALRPRRLRSRRGCGDGAVVLGNANGGNRLSGATLWPFPLDGFGLQAMLSKCPSSRSRGMQ